MLSFEQDADGRGSEKEPHQHEEDNDDEQAFTVAPDRMAGSKRSIAKVAGVEDDSDDLPPPPA